MSEHNILRAKQRARELWGAAGFAFYVEYTQTYCVGYTNDTPWEEVFVCRGTSWLDAFNIARAREANV